MLLKEILDQLLETELNQISLGGQNAGEVNGKNQHILVGHINMGLAALFSRFSLKEGRVTVVLRDTQYLYPLHSKFDVNNQFSLEVNRWLQMSDGSLFADDLLKIEKVQFNDYDFPLNDGTKYSFSTPTLGSLGVPKDIVDKSVDLPDELKTDTVDVIYRAKHTKLVSELDDELDAEETEVDLPYPFLEPLVFYVASRMHSPAGLSNQNQLGMSYAARYEQACQKLEAYNLQLNWSQSNQKAVDRGFC